MKTAQQLYDSIISSVPAITTINTDFGEYPNAHAFNNHVDRVSFEQQVWFRCKPDKQLANDVMQIAGNKLRELF